MTARSVARAGQSMTNTEEIRAMKKILLSLAPVPVEALKSLLHHSPGVPDTDVVDGHDMSAERAMTTPSGSPEAMPFAVATMSG